jgi:hypothetical protein
MSISASESLDAEGFTATNRDEARDINAKMRCYTTLALECYKLPEAELYCC